MIFAVLLLPLYFESGGTVRKSVGVLRRETFLDMVSIDDTFRRLTSRFLVFLLMTHVEGEC